tara:strand:+ start:470 stop:1000 length:531 start_codon:yes stop_codon:yes gene_type:complete
MTQYARPDADITSEGEWSGNAETGSLYTEVDETSANDSDVMEAGDSGCSGTTIELRLSDVTDPQSASGHIVHWRARDDSNDSELTVKLMMGSTEIASQTNTLTGSFADYSDTLNSTQANNISDYTDLRLRFTFTDSECMGSAGFISHAYVEFPDVAAAAPAAEPDLPGAAFLMFVD